MVAVLRSRMVNVMDAGDSSTTWLTARLDDDVRWADGLPDGGPSWVTDAFSDLATTDAVDMMSAANALDVDVALPSASSVEALDAATFADVFDAVLARHPNFEPLESQDLLVTAQDMEVDVIEQHTERASKLVDPFDAAVERTVRGHAADLAIPDDVTAENRPDDVDDHSPDDLMDDDITRINHSTSLPDGEVAHAADAATGGSPEVDLPTLMELDTDPWVDVAHDPATLDATIAPGVRSVIDAIEHVDRFDDPDSNDGIDGLDNLDDGQGSPDDD